MAEKKPKLVEPVLPQRDVRRWSQSHGTYIAGRAYIDGADETAAQMEAKWGADRLRRLVGPELREKFDRQRYKFNQAIWHGELDDVRREAGRMVKAWEVLDREAASAGKTPLDLLVWEVPLKDGTVAAIVPDSDHAHRVASEGRHVSVYTLDEIGRLLELAPGVIRAKLTFPGATVTAVRRNAEDPLNDVHDTAWPIDDPIPFGEVET